MWRIPVRTLLRSLALVSQTWLFITLSMFAGLTLGACSGTAKLPPLHMDTQAQNDATSSEMESETSDALGQSNEEETPGIQDASAPRFPSTCSQDEECTELEADPCQAALCDTQSGRCVLSPLSDESPCDDGDPCTVNTTCAAGVCGAGEPQPPVCEGVDCGGNLAGLEEKTHQHHWTTGSTELHLWASLRQGVVCC